MLVAPTIENGGNMQIGRFKVYLSAGDSRLTLAGLFSHRRGVRSASRRLLNEVSRVLFWSSVTVIDCLKGS